MTRLEHFIRGNGLTLSDISEWSRIKERRIRAVLDGTEAPHLDDAYLLTSACSYLLGRRVRITELFDFEEAKP
jgi:hypothetical protein